MNYTKGKWKIYEDHMTFIRDIVAEDGIGFFHKIIAHIPYDTPESETNARLIASAPDMYEALKRFLQSSACKNHCDPDDMTCDTNYARKAIAKAEGK